MTLRWLVPLTVVLLSHPGYGSELQLELRLLAFDLCGLRGWAQGTAARATQESEWSGFEVLSSPARPSLASGVAPPTCLHGSAVQEDPSVRREALFRCLGQRLVDVTLARLAANAGGL